MSEAAESSTSTASQRRRARQQGRSRSCRIAISVDDLEQAELEQAARAEGLALSASVADKALAAARRSFPQVTAPLREALTELIRATVQVQKVGTNLNQAVAALNATGQAPGNLIQYARYATTVIEKLDQIAGKIAQRLP
ncbi:MAG TPA: hypothetical protein VN969_28645 [Streptosporangiaceae bacterium]|jgi:hypothetical protein|nr:hypothetical protein [Streptosporangiaceae bacterium]